MSSKSQGKARHPFWRRLRIYFRRFRITVLFTLFLLVCAGAYLNLVGLPAFIKRPVLANLRHHGVDLQFSRLRVRGYRGIVAEDVRVLGTNGGVLPEFAARSADVRLNYPALLRFKLDVTGIVLRGGRLVWHLPATNAPAAQLAITNLTAGLRFLPGDEWSLDYLRADFGGAQFQVSGSVTNASALRDWPMFQARTNRPPGATLARLQFLHDTLAQLRMVSPPEIRLKLEGDATDPRTFSGFFSARSAGAVSPWGDFQNALLTARLSCARSNAEPAAEILLRAERLRTQWASLRDLDLLLNAELAGTNPAQCRVALSASRMRTDWATADVVNLSGDWRQDLTAVVPRKGQVELRLDNANSRWLTAGTVWVSGRFSPASQVIPPDPALAGWSRVLPYALQLTCALTNAAHGDVKVDALGVAANWDAAKLTVTNLQVRLRDRTLDADAALDVASRRLEFDGRARFDFHLLDPVMTDKSRDWLNHFTWHEPPALAASGSLTLPAWTNRHPDWRGEVQPGIVMRGSVNLTNASYRGISALQASTQLTYSNRVWHLSDLLVTRPEGTLVVDLRSEELTHDYRIKVRGPFDPRVLESQLDEKGRRGLGYLEYNTPPWVEAEINGRWYDHERTAARASVVWTNFSFRAQHADRLEATLEYTNKLLRVFQPRVERGTEKATADAIAFDFESNRAYLTNGYTDTDPMAIAIAIGPKVAAAVSRYQFEKPPIAHVAGVIPLKGERDADLHFDLEGGPFRWMRFNLPHIAGHIDWANESVTLTNISASFYGGAAAGDARFDVRERGNTPFRFALSVSNADLHALMSDLHSPTNQLAGRLSGWLGVTDANVEDWRSWNGYGHASLKDGLIWDTPIFGMMSGVLNTVAPGIGNSRASDAGGSFTINNSVIRTRDLEIRASGMRLQYDGTVDFSTQVHARVQADLLRDTWLVGKAVSAALWPVSKLFEYKVTGTLARPEAEPIYFVPKIFLAPLHPMKTLKEMFQENPGATNAVPVVTP